MGGGRWIMAMSLPCLGVLNSCATAFVTPQSFVLLRADDPEAMKGVIVLRDGKPQVLSSVLIQDRSSQGFGTWQVTQNTDLYSSGPGLLVLGMERSVFASSYALEVKKPGYNSQTLLLERHIHPLFYLNIFNLFGFLVDFYSGFMWEYSPSQIQLKFTPRP